MVGAETAVMGATLLSGAVKGFGALSGGKAEIRRAKLEKTIADTQANQADQAYREDMIRQLSNIKAIRASSGASTTSPSFGVFMDENRATADQNRQRKVSSFKLQGMQKEADAAMLRRLSYLKTAGIAIDTLGSMAAGA